MDEEDMLDGRLVAMVVSDKPVAMDAEGNLLPPPGFGNVKFEEIFGNGPFYDPASAKPCGPHDCTCYDSDPEPGPDVAEETEGSRSWPDAPSDAREQSTRALANAEKLLNAAEEVVRKYNNLDAANSYMEISDRWLRIAEAVAP